MFSIFSKCIYISFHFAFVPWSTCGLQVRPRLPLPSPTSRGSNRLITSFSTAQPRANGFLNAASAVAWSNHWIIINSYLLSTGRLPGPFVELWSVSVSPLHCFSPLGLTPVFNEISSWRTCICGQFNILCKMLAPRASKSSEGYRMTSGHLSEKNENFYSHKNVYTHFIGDVLAVTKGLKTNPNILQLVTR